MRCCTKRYALDLRVLTQQSVQRNAAGDAFLRMQQVGVDPQAGLNAGQRSILRRFRVKVAQKAGLHLRRKRHRHGKQSAVAGILHQDDVRERPGARVSACRQTPLAVITQGSAAADCSGSGTGAAAAKHPEKDAQDRHPPKKTPTRQTEYPQQHGRKDKNKSDVFMAESSNQVKKSGGKKGE